MNEAELIQELIRAAQALPLRDEDKLKKLQYRIELVTRQLFGETSHYLKQLTRIYFHPAAYPATAAMYDQSWRSGQTSLVALLEAMHEQIRLFGDKSISNPTPVVGEISNRVFLVHGHDEEMKQTVARALETLKVNPIILHDQPSRGRTTIEKFTDNADVAFAVVLLSPDDLAYARHTSPENAM